MVSTGRAALEALVAEQFAAGIPQTQEGIVAKAALVSTQVAGVGPTRANLDGCARALAEGLFGAAFLMANPTRRAGWVSLCRDKLLDACDHLEAQARH